MVGVEFLLQIDENAQWTFFGGKIDPSDRCRALTTALRELSEESGGYFPLPPSTELGDVSMQAGGGALERVCGGGLESVCVWISQAKYVLFFLHAPKVDASHVNAHLNAQRRG